MPRSPRPIGTAPLLCILTGMLAGCAGPSLSIDSQDPTFVDGRRVGGANAPSIRLPFRYYGTTQVDTLPRDLDGEADFQRQPTRGAVVIEEPVTPWLFPFDFVGEVLVRIVSDGAQHYAPAVPAEPGPRTAPGPAEFARLSQRALDARHER